LHPGLQRESLVLAALEQWERGEVGYLDSDDLFDGAVAGASRYANPLRQPITKRSPSTSLRSAVPSAARINAQAELEGVLRLKIDGRGERRAYNLPERGTDGRDRRSVVHIRMLVVKDDAFRRCVVAHVRLPPTTGIPVRPDRSAMHPF
jgi:hypothetical protein